MNSLIEILVFGKGLAAGGQTAQCEVKQESLVIHFAAPALASQMEQNLTVLPFDVKNLTVFYRHISAKVAGFDHDQLQLNWQQDEATWSLMPSNLVEQKAMLAALRVHATEQNSGYIISGLNQWYKTTQSQSIVWKSILYGLASLSLLVVFVIWQHDLVATWAANRVSIKTEKRLGDSVLKSLNPEVNFIQTGAAVTAVESIGKKLTAGSKYQYQWYVSKDQTVNAFAIPGGIIVVNSGLLKAADSPDELAAVLAHEVQHVEQKHALKNMMNSAGIAAVVLAVLGDANAVVMLMAHQVSAQYFNRQVETDADLKGAALLQQKNIKADGMVSFFEKMNAGFTQNKTTKNTDKKNADKKNLDKKEEPQETSVAGWFSSHPDTLNRIKIIKQYLAKNPCKTCVSLSTNMVWNKPEILRNIKAARANGAE